MSAPEDCEPLSALLPGQAPEPEHVVAFFADQVSIVAAPELTVLGLAVSVIEGAEAETVTMADCVAEPPVPVQVEVRIRSYWRVHPSTTCRWSPRRHASLPKRYRKSRFAIAKTGWKHRRWQPSTVMPPE